MIHLARLLNRLLVGLTLLMLIVTVATALLWPAATSSFHERERPPLTIQQIRDLAHPVTLEVPFEQLVETRIDGYSGGVRCLVLARGRAWIGIDLEQAQLTIDDTGRHATLILPRPTVLRAELDHEQTSVALVSRRGLWQLAARRRRRSVGDRTDPPPGSAATAPGRR